MFYVHSKEYILKVILQNSGANNQTNFHWNFYKSNAPSKILYHCWFIYLDALLIMMVWMGSPVAYGDDPLFFTRITWLHCLCTILMYSKYSLYIRPKRIFILKAKCFKVWWVGQVFLLLQLSRGKIQFGYFLIFFYLILKYSKCH